MLEYSKIILSNFNFDDKLFEKEYRKAIRHLDDDERTILREWIRDRRNVLID